MYLKGNVVKNIEKKLPSFEEWNSRKRQVLSSIGINKEQAKVLKMKKYSGIKNDIIELYLFNKEKIRIKNLFLELNLKDSFVIVYNNVDNILNDLFVDSYADSVLDNIYSICCSYKLIPTKYYFKARRSVGENIDINYNIQDDEDGDHYIKKFRTVKVKKDDIIVQYYDSHNYDIKRIINKDVFVSNMEI
jgi:hypothetical protein